MESSEKNIREKGTNVSVEFMGLALSVFFLPLKKLVLI